MLERRQETWQLALIQPDLRLGEPGLNLEHLLNFMEESVAGPKKPDILMLPEMWNTGYALDRIHELKEADGKELRQVLGSFAGKHQVHVVAGSIAEMGPDQKVRNTAYIFSRQGEEVYRYSKIHLFRLMGEEKKLAAGLQSAVFALDGCLCGAAICYDIRFPELARSLALAGAKVLFVPAEWPHPRLHHWRTLAMARAIENQMYVVACNRVGRGGGEHFFGHSLIINPWGEVIAEGGEEEEVLTAEITLPLVDKVRAQIPVFEDRRPELYRF